MDFISVIVTISAFINLFLGIFVYIKSTDDKAKNVFSFMTFCLFLWAIAKVIYREVDSVEASIFWDRILYAIPIFVTFSMTYFSFVFIRRPKFRNKYVVSLAYIVSAVMVIVILFTDKIISSVILRPGQEKEMIYGDMYSLYSLYLAFFMGLSWLIMVQKIKTIKGVERSQLIIVFWGIFSSSFLSLVTNVVLLKMGIFDLVWAGHILTLLMVVAIAYAIVKHHLMNIKFALRKSSVVASSFLTVFLLFIAVRHFFYDNSASASSRFWFDSLFLMFALYLYPKVKNYYYKFANKYFFSSLYEMDEVIEEISNELTTLDIKNIYDGIFETLTRAFHSVSFMVVRYNKNKNHYRVQYKKGFDWENKNKFSLGKVLQEKYVNNNKIILVEELKRFKETTGIKKEIKFFEKNKISVLVPMGIKDNVVGLLILGPKETKETYNIEDLKVLGILSSQVAIAIENALLYDEKLNFSKKLEEEIKLATSELRKANKKLMKLDEAKSEFISIASHQLRTPLTVIKGYISMILENNFGKVTKKQAEPLNKIKLSADRLIQLVENLLNISRIESGRLQFRYEVMDLKTIVDSVIEELETKASEKSIKIVYKVPKEELPKVKIDNEKIRQVAMNLVDNAIKYTEAGTVTISLKKVRRNLHFCVADSGMGISDDDIASLFKKFSRGTGVSAINTEGTGLGLYVAKQMIDAHKGKIWAESKGEGHGSKFCFEIPINKK